MTVAELIEKLSELNLKLSEKAQSAVIRCYDDNGDSCESVDFNVFEHNGQTYVEIIGGSP